MAKETLINCMILVWWMAGMVWLFSPARRRVADIRPAWHRYVCILVIFPTYLLLSFAAWVLMFFALELPDVWDSFMSANGKESDHA